MGITEATRHQMYTRLEEVLGVDDAATLMSHLPPVGWADVATRADLDRLAAQFQADLSGLRVEMADLRVELHREFGAFRDAIHEDRRAAQRQMLFVLVVALVSLLVTVATAL